MSDIVAPLLQWLNANPQWAGLVTFIISASESVAIIGTIVPGSITMTAIGALAGAGIIPLWETLFWAMLGAVIGDGISYWMGHYFNDRLRRIWPFSTNPNLLEKGEGFVLKYGVMSVFIGRFVGPVRAIVPLVAGMLGMKPLLFTIANITSAIGWAPIYMLPGILLGAASLELPPDIAMHVMLVLLLITLFILLCCWFVYKILQLISQQTENMLVRFWNVLKKSRYFRITTIMLKHHDPQQHHGQLTLVFYFLLTSIALFALLVDIKYVGASNILVNDVLYHLFRGMRNHTLDSIMLSITFLGQRQVILPVVFVLVVWLFIKKRGRAAVHALALGIFAMGGISFIKHFMQIQRPWGLFQTPEGFSMPSGHAVLSATIYMGIAFMIASPLPKKRRWLIYFPAAIISFLVGMSRVYLGAHWFTDVLAAWLLSAALLILIILSYHRQYEKPISLVGISTVCLLTLSLSYSWFYHQHFNQFKINFTQLDWPITEINLKTWWIKDEAIPEPRVSLFGFPSQNINIQWVGDISKIKNSLLKVGWALPPPRDWISTLHRISDIRSSQYLPLVSPQYLDKQPSLILVKHVGTAKKLLVLRLWESSRIIKESRSPLWVGTIGVIPRSYSWLFRKRRDSALEANNIISTIATPQWEWKQITVTLPINKHKTLLQKIILIKPTTLR
ncbi:MAG: hypothetical protein A3F11_05290 [Gammaproteobacteria bacterium RIFCSPHIGHO2_12_FULL_37_14]|nr:MAG: hypothetical protein A3F11_05290 [Gammaproteobacteria bacterium RIFCSPHIGHO2_12_FULL_37_14]